MSETMPEDGLYAELQMNSGNILCRLEFERAPITVASFVGLAQGSFELPNSEYAGKPYFDGLNFHRVEPGFVVQGGDPKGNGTGGPGYQFPNEIDPTLQHDSAGILSMANAGPDTNGSQFFITLAPTPFLDGGYSVFGKVVSGLDTVHKIQKGDVIQKVSIQRKGAAAKSFNPDWQEFQSMIATKNKQQNSAQSADSADAEEMLLAHIAKTWPQNAQGEKSGLTESPEGLGLRYKIIQAGKGPSGAEAKAGNYTMHYTLWVPQSDGSLAQIDSSRERGKPLSIAPEQVVKGWGLTLPQMKQGEQRVLLIPGNSDLGYGKRGSPPVIPPNSPLLFEMETISFQ